MLNTPLNYTNPSICQAYILTSWLRLPRPSYFTPPLSLTLPHLKLCVCLLVKPVPDNRSKPSLVPGGRRRGVADQLGSHSGLERLTYRALI
jgi:hypothetical protein